MEEIDKVVKMFDSKIHNGRKKIRRRRQRSRKRRKRMIS